MLKNNHFFPGSILVVSTCLLLFTAVTPGQVKEGLASVPYGQVLESLTFRSRILGQEVHYSIYLPPDYDISKRSYPVTYLLHGGGGNETHWVQFCEVNLTADRLIATREIPPMIIVMPAAEGTWFINDYKGEVRWEDMFIQELMPYIDKNYRTRIGAGEFTNKKFRAISGLSMGGYGSLVLAMHHPDLFIASAPYSSGIFGDEYVVSMSEERYNNRFAKLYGGEGLKGEARLTDHWKNNSPLHLAKTLPPEELKSVFWYIDCGDDDYLSPGSVNLHLVFRERQIPHEFRVRDGGHQWDYWRIHIDDGLRFIGKAFLWDN